MENVWSRTARKQTYELFLLMGEDKKYATGNASDFECFALFCKRGADLVGNIEAERVADEIAALSGAPITLAQLCECDAARLWNKCCAKLYASEFFNDEKYNYMYDTNIPNLCVEKNNLMSSMTDLNILLSECIKEGTDDLEKVINILLNTAKNTLFIKFEKQAFDRPNGFAAEREYKQIFKDEKYNLNIILSQLMFEFIYKNKQRKIQLILDGKDDAKYIQELVEYIILRNLNVRIHIIFADNIDVKKIKDICLLSRENCFITPVLKNKEQLARLSKIYPVGAIELI